MKKRAGFYAAPYVLLLYVLMIMTDRSGICLLTFAAAALHECGHLLAARCLGIPLRGIRVDLLGIRIDIGGRMLSYGEEWILCAAGPLTSLLLAALGAIFWRNVAFAVTFSCASLILGLLNLLPIRTFDGGRMLECFLHAALDDRISARIMSLCSFFFLFLLWACAVYFLLRAGDGLSLFCFSVSLFFRFFDGEF